MFECPNHMFMAARSGYLWHYTTMAGLVGIFSSEELWATEARFLNDAEEIRWASAFLVKEIECQVGRLSLSETDPAYRLLGRQLQDQLFLKNVAGVFIASFSANPDGIQMWQAYGRGGGFALGFEATRLREAGLVSGFSLVKCIYPEGNDPKITAWIERSIELLRTLEPREADPQIVVSGRKLLASIKHPTFSHEDEWRLVRPWQSDQPSGYAVELSVRGGLGTPVPFVSLELMNPAARKRVRSLIETGVPELRDPVIRNKHADWVLWPISRVVVGPTHQRDQALLSIRLVCQAKSGPDIPMVVPSSTPLQANP